MSFGEFLGFGGYSRAPEGYMSWQHLTFASLITLAMIVCAVILGRRNRNRDEKTKNRVLIAAAILINAFELFKIVVLCIRHNNPLQWLNVLPLFLCSIQLIAIPLAAFCKGRIKDASLDFVMVFGILGAILGVYFAGQNYGCYPVISMDNVVSGITHCISGFASLYIMISGMGSMKKQTLPLTLTILGGFCVAAYVANIFLNCNYMFLQQGDGTPYDIVYNFVNGSPVLYPILVVAMFVVYIVGFHLIYHSVKDRRAAKAEAQQAARETANM